MKQTPKCIIKKNKKNDFFYFNFLINAFSMDCNFCQDIVGTTYILPCRSLCRSCDQCWKDAHSILMTKCANCHSSIDWSVPQLSIEPPPYTDSNANQLPITQLAKDAPELTLVYTPITRLAKDAPELTLVYTPFLNSPKMSPTLIHKWYDMLNERYLQLNKMHPELSPLRNKLISEAERILTTRHIKVEVVSRSNRFCTWKTEDGEYHYLDKDEYKYISQSDFHMYSSCEFSYQLLTTKHGMCLYKNNVLVRKLPFCTAVIDEERNLLYAFERVYITNKNYSEPQLVALKFVKQSLITGEELFTAITMVYHASQDVSVSSSVISQHEFLMNNVNTLNRRVIFLDCQLILNERGDVYCKFCYQVEGSLSFETNIVKFEDNIPPKMLCQWVQKRVYNNTQLQYIPHSNDVWIINNLYFEYRDTYLIFHQITVK